MTDADSVCLCGFTPFVYVQASSVACGVGHIGFPARLSGVVEVPSSLRQATGGLRDLHHYLIHVNAHVHISTLIRGR
jgi:hypothetical protein